ncbi:hypothetical protein WA026_012126 [Henosepilachna vigintioctopunctata]|uniref:Opsin n=1 Tax=Henosepilachna vigintioctopunctata TaxID=420089 RepID=A0AAW1V6N9_9CUCU
MELDVMKNLSINGTFDPNTYHHIQRHYYLDGFLAILGIGSITSCILIIIIMRKYQILRTRTNSYVVNLCVSNILYLFFSPLFLNLFDAAERISSHEICILDEALMLLFLGIFVFACTILADWYIINYKSLNASIRCRASYNFITLTIWLIILSLFLTICIQCSYGITIFPMISITAIFVFIFSFVFVLIIHIVKFFRSRFSSGVVAKSNMELAIVTCYFLCWLPNWGFTFSFLFASGRSSLDAELSTFGIAHTYPIVLLALLYYKDRDFKLCFNNFLKSEKMETNANDEGRRYSKEHLSALV